MIGHTRKAGHQVDLKLYGNALIHASRNKALATVEDNSNFVLMVDDDMLPEKDSLLRLLEHDVPVVSAACTTRVPPVQLAVRVYDPEKDQFALVEELRPNTLAKGPFAVGAAFLLIRKDVVDLLREYHLSAHDWLDENRRVFDRLHVRSEFREKERARKEEMRRYNFEKGQDIRVFDFWNGQNESQYGEDITLARKLIALDIPVVIDTSVAVGHLGEYSYGTWDLTNEYVSSRNAV